MVGMRIRPEDSLDLSGIRAVNLAVFETSMEANLVEALRALAAPIVSLVAEDAGAIVGHILFSPVTLAAHPEIRVMGLAPMAVMPVRQRQGIGSTLIRDGLHACKRIGATAVVVLGHATYYPRFGFAPASRFGLKCQYDVPDEAFMAVEIESGALQNRGGTVTYHPAFEGV